MAGDKRIPELPVKTIKNGTMLVPIYDGSDDVTYAMALDDLLPEVSDDSNQWDPDFTYSEDDIAVFEDQLYVSLQDNNLDNLPSDIGSTFWVIGVKSPSGLVPYQAGIFTSAQVSVLKERSSGVWALYYLTNLTRPYNSTNFATELAAGDWTFVGKLFIADIPGLQAALDDKLDIADYNDRFKGKYTTLVALQTAYPTASVGDYAQVDTGPGVDVINYSWDTDEGWIPGGSGSGATNTDALVEGTTNLYFTTARVLATLLTGLNTALTGTPASTDSILIAFGKIANFIGNIFTTAHIWTLQQTFTLAPRFSSVTASQYLKVDGSKDLTSVSAIPATDITQDSTHRFATDTEKTSWNAKEDASNKGIAGGYAGLDGSGKVPSAQLPAYVDDVLEYANFAALPGAGTAGIIYVTLDTNFEYRWSGSAYIQLVSSPGTTDALAEGSTNLYFTVARVLASALTGLSLVTAGTPAATDTILAAFGKVANFIANIYSTAHTWTLAQTFSISAISPQFASTIQTLTDAATVAWDGALGQNAVVTIAGNRTLGAITNPINGVVYTLRVIQDGTGNRTLAFNAAYLFNNSISALIDRRASGWTILRFRYDGTNFVYLDGNDEEGIIDLGNLTGAVSIDLSLGRKFKCVQTGNWTSFTFTNEVIGRSYALDITRTSNYTLALTAGKFRLPLGQTPGLTNPATNGIGTSVDKLSFECAVASRLDVVITPDLQSN